MTSLALVGDDLRRLFWPPLNPPVVTRFSVPDPLDLKGVFRKPCGLCQQLEKLPVKVFSGETAGAVLTSEKNDNFIRIE